jgi:hypothetical protein
MKQISFLHIELVAVCAFILAVAACSSTTENQESAGETPAGETLRLARTATLTTNNDLRALSHEDAGWRFASSQQWAYAAFAPFDGFGKPDVKGEVEVELQVSNGRMAIGLLTDHNEILQEKFVAATPASQKLTFTLGSANLESVVFRSAAPSGTVSEAVIRTVDYVLQVNHLDGAVSLGNIVKDDPSAALDSGHPVRVSTEHKYAYAARIPLAIPPLGNSMAFVRVRGQVAHGHMGISVLDKTGAIMKNERFYDPAPSELDYFVLIDNPANAGSVMFRSDKDEKSEIVVEDVSVFRLM